MHPPQLSDSSAASLDDSGYSGENIHCHRGNESTMGLWFYGSQVLLKAEEVSLQKTDDYARSLF